jgi:hypothetical protein
MRFVEAAVWRWGSGAVEGLCEVARHAIYFDAQVLQVRKFDCLHANDKRPFYRDIHKYPCLKGEDD